VTALDMGIVAQIDLAEIRAPFVRAGKIAGGVALVLVMVGAGLFMRMTNPFIRRLERRVDERTADLARANRELQEEIAERRQVEQRLLEHQERLRLLASELAMTEERERRQIATELHDRIGQTLAVAQMKIDALGATAPDAVSHRRLDEVSALVDQMDEDIRTLTFELSPPVLQLGLAPAVRWLAEQLEAEHGLRVSVENGHEELPLDDDIRALMFRTVRELLMNVVKHAHADRAQVRMRREGGLVHVVVTDDGVGFDPTASGPAGPHQAFGLFSVREHLRFVGGSLDIQSSPGRGAAVRVTAPVQVPEAVAQVSS